MPANWNPSRGAIRYTPPAPPKRPPVQATTPPPGIQAVVPPPPEAGSLTKTSGAAGTGPSGAGGGQRQLTPIQAEASSNAGLPFRDQTVNRLPGATPEGELPEATLGDPAGAVIGALSALGYDPGSANPAVKNLIEAAPAIEEAFLIRQVLSQGPAGALAGDDAAQLRAYQTFVRDVVARGSFRQEAARATQGAAPAAQQLLGYLNTPEGANVLQDQDNVWLQQAQGRLLRPGALPKTLSNLYAQQYNVPGEEARGKAIQGNLERAALRSAARPGSAIDYFRTFRP